MKFATISGGGGGAVLASRIENCGIFPACCCCKAIVFRAVTGTKEDKATDEDEDRDEEEEEEERQLEMEEDSGTNYARRFAAVGQGIPDTVMDFKVSAELMGGPPECPHHTIAHHAKRLRGSESASRGVSWVQKQEMWAR
ncbi:hypothetical protein Q7C36_020611 [Tachysurus vachellii]|uniref:Uncharacterized protein n=1 Tax=Tachysurus vachellii TaxID=175792 RepID=A0AA88J7E6_TACVA|nr:hypothetical protein Q7C36_020611 [Tachysurus vachellii]